MSSRIHGSAERRTATPDTTSSPWFSPIYMRADVYHSSPYHWSHKIHPNTTVNADAGSTDPADGFAVVTNVVGGGTGFPGDALQTNRTVHGSEYVRTSSPRKKKQGNTHKHTQTRSIFGHTCFSFLSHQIHINNQNLPLPLLYYQISNRNFKVGTFDCNLSHGWDYLQPFSCPAK